MEVEAAYPMNGSSEMSRTPPVRSDAMAPSVDDTTSLLERVRIAASVARSNADDVDRAARFPSEAISALKAQRLLGLMVPQALGGESANISTLADICYQLGRACASTAMIFAMHQIKAACLVRHAEGRWQTDFLHRVAQEQLLLASSTTEGDGGGDVRSSSAPIKRDGGRIALNRAATVMSYGAQADAVVTTARRDADAPASDQVLVVFTRDQYRLQPSGGWDTLGMRGTCSLGFALQAEGVAGQIIAEPFATIHTQTMTPVAHLLWTGVWAGIAAAAVERSRLCLRTTVRKASGQLPLGMPHFRQASSSLRTLRTLLTEALTRYEHIASDPSALSSPDFQTRIILLKVEASDLAVATVMSTMRVCGLSGYRNDSETSLGRHLRDVMSAPLMINNDRLLAGIGAAPLLSETPSSIWA